MTDLPTKQLLRPDEVAKGMAGKMSHAQRIDIWCPHFSGFSTLMKQDPISKKGCEDCSLHNIECPYEGGEEEK
jgi:hypothetical protein